jgi:hypothetical protein
MGFRCSSLQVFAGQIPSDQTVQAIVEAVRQLVQLDSPQYQEISQEEFAATDRTKWATRSLIVAVPTRPASAAYPWVGVYDETTEEDTPNLEKLTLELVPYALSLAHSQSLKPRWF